LHQETYNNGKASDFVQYAFKNALSLDQIKAMKSELSALKRKSTGRKIISTDLISWLAGALNTIGNTIGELGCDLLGGSWSNGPPGSTASYNWNGSFTLSCPLDSVPDPIQGTISDEDYFAELNLTVVSGSSSGGSSSGGDSSGGSSSGGSTGGSSYNPMANLSDKFWSTLSAFGDYLTSMGGGSGALVKVETDILSLTYPCVAKIINKLTDSDTNYKSFVHGFLGNGVPTMHWEAQNMAWDPTGSLGTGSYFGKTKAYTFSQNTNNILNTNMLQHSSKLLVVATIIHESVHSVVHYYLTNALYSSDTTTNFPSWLSGTRAYINLAYYSSDYTTHTSMLTNYFKQMVAVLKHALPGLTDKEYAEALLVGANNAGNTPSVTTAQINEVQADYDAMRTLYSISNSDMDSFISANMVVATPPNLCN